MNNDRNLVAGVATLVRPAPKAWSRIYCRSLWLLIPTTGIFSAMRVVAPGRLDALAQTLNVEPLTAFLVAFFLFLFLLLTSFFLCLRDRVTRGGKEKVLVSNESIQRTAISPLLSRATDIRTFTSVAGSGFIIPPPQWHARRGEIKRLVVVARRTLGQTRLNVFLSNGGRVWLFPVEEWVPSHHHDGPEHVGRDVPRPGGRATLQVLRSLPLVQALLAHHYHVEFVRAGFLGTRPIGLD